MSVPSRRNPPAIPAITPFPRFDRSARPQTRSNIKLTAAREEDRFVGPLPLAIGVLALLATLSYAVRFGGKVEDPNYLSARGRLNVYELGRNELEKDYDSPIYDEVLAALAKVQPDSSSAGPAAALVADIRRKADVFHRRVKARTAAEAVAQRAHLDRESAFLEAQQRDLVMPKTDYPECEQENHALGR